MMGGRQSYLFGLIFAAFTVVVVYPQTARGATYTVSKTADTNDGTCDADCSLREAITAANGGAGNVIEFNINGGGDAGCTGAGGVCTIKPASALPNVTGGSITINGYTQNGASANTAEAPNPLNTVLNIVIDGTVAGTGSDGITLASANNVVKGVVINNFQGSGSGDGIVISASSGNKIQGCFVGTTYDGTAGKMNNGMGVNITGAGSSNNVIGTDGDGASDAAERNLLSGNRNPNVILTSSAGTGNRVSGNIIGVAKNGLTDITTMANAYGVSIYTAFNTVGTNGDGVADAVEMNVISGNYSGVRIVGANSNVIAGNIIGLNWGGTVDVGNAYNGIDISGASSSTVIGTNGNGVSDTLERNIISGNASEGIYVNSSGNSNKVMGNYIGTDKTGTVDLGNDLNGINVAGSSITIGTDGNGTADAAEGNVISGNGLTGVRLDTASHVVAGNIIGLNAAGTGAVGNSDYGVLVRANSNRVGTNGDGTSDTIERNVISSNSTSGIGIGNAADYVVIAGNYIGVGSDGTSDLGNLTHGIYTVVDGAANNTIGGDSSAEANVIAYNGNAASEYGVYLIGATSDNNVILRNSFFSNQDIGIKLAGDGANNDQASPVISSQAINGNSLDIIGTSGNNATVQLFDASSDNDEGETYLSQAVADGAGNWAFTVGAPYNAADNKLITTATVAPNGTSEFSATYTVLNAVPVVSAATFNGTEDTNLTVTLPVATDGNGDALTYKISTLPLNGSLYQTPDGTTLGAQIAGVPTTVTDAGRRVIFVPALNASGAGYGNLGFKANDGTADSAEATIVVNISAVNDAPLANAQAPSVNLDTALPLTLNATDADNDVLTYILVAAPSNGALTGFNSATGALTYTPNVGYTGGDSFTFKANDGTVDGNTPTVSVTVNAFVRTVAFSAATQASSENGGNITVTTNLSVASAYNVTVPFTVGGSASNPADYGITASPFTITAGSTSANATITVANDALDENDETVVLTMGAPVNASQGAVTVHTATITDDDPLPFVQWTTASQSQNENAGNMTATAQLSAVSGRNVTVPFTTGGTAATPADFTVTLSPLTINAGGTTAVATITVVNDALDEDDETTILTVGVPGNATVGAIGVHTATMTDDDTTGATLTESGASSLVTEGNPATDTYTVVLDAEPTAVVAVAMNPGADVTVSPASLTFTAANWNIPQTVTVSAVDDEIAEGPHDQAIVHTLHSADADYEGITYNVVAHVTDNDAAGISITESGGATNVAEGGATDAYAIVLTSEPVANVTISLTPNAQVGVAPLSLTFTPADWNVVRVVTVSAVDDSRAEGPHAGMITHTAASSDPNYHGLTVASVTPSLTDNDSAGVVVTESGGLTETVEGGPADSYDIVLTSQPGSDVTVTIAVDGAQLEADRGFVSFVPGNWNVAQTVMVRAKDDGPGEGSHASTLTHLVASADPGYHGVAVAVVTVMITDPETPAVEAEEEVENTPPTVYAGADFQAVEGKPAKLYGNASDADGDALTYEWVQTSGTSVTLAQSGSEPVARFTAPATPGTTLSFSLNASDGLSEVSEPVSVTIVRGSVQASEAKVEDVQGQVMAVSNSGAIVTKTESQTSEGTRSMLDLGGGFSLASASTAVRVLYIGDRILVADHLFDNQRGIVILVDTASATEFELDLLDPNLDLLDGVFVAPMSSAGDNFGRGMGIGDINADGFTDIFVLAPGTSAGTVYVLDSETLELRNLILGSADELLKSPLMALTDMNGEAGTEAMLGVVNSAKLALIPGAERALSAASDSASAFNGLVARSDFPTLVDFGVDEPDFVMDLSIAVTDVVDGDINGDGEQDVVMGSKDDGMFVLAFGDGGLGSGTILDDSFAMVSDEDTTYTSIEVADVSGDGIDDIIVGYGEAEGGNGRIVVRLGTSAWLTDELNFDGAMVVEGEEGKAIGTWLIVSDADGDGVADIYTNSGGNDSMVINLYDGMTGSDTDSGGSDGTAAGASLGPGGLSCALRAGAPRDSRAVAGMVAVFAMMGIGIVVWRRRRRVVSLGHRVTPLPP